MPVPVAAAAFVEEVPAKEEEKNEELKVEIIRPSLEEEKKANAAPPSPEVLIRQPLKPRKTNFMDVDLFPRPKKREDSSEGRKFRRFEKKEEEADHMQIPVPKRNWVYKLEPTTVEENDRERDFIFVVPYCFATAATPEAL